MILNNVILNANLEISNQMGDCLFIALNANHSKIQQFSCWVLLFDPIFLNFMDNEKRGGNQKNK